MKAGRELERAAHHGVAAVDGQPTCVEGESEIAAAAPGADVPGRAGHVVEIHAVRRAQGDQSRSGGPPDRRAVRQRIGARAGALGRRHTRRRGSNDAGGRRRSGLTPADHEAEQPDESQPGDGADDHEVPPRAPAGRLGQCRVRSRQVREQCAAISAAVTAPAAPASRSTNSATCRRPALRCSCRARCASLRSDSPMRRDGVDLAVIVAGSRVHATSGRAQPRRRRDQDRARRPTTFLR